jgi:hypothetical protein
MHVYHHPFTVHPDRINSGAADLNSGTPRKIATGMLASTHCRNNEPNSDKDSGELAMEPKIAPAKLGSKMANIMKGAMRKLLLFQPPRDSTRL